jgi:peptidoglycan/LPS O-acetylase OafA/YrhL
MVPTVEMRTMTRMANMREAPGRDRRQWADAALILTGLSLFGLAVWFPPFSTTDEARQAISLWPYYAAAGGLVLIGLILGQRWDYLRLARVLLVTALAVLVVALFRVRSVGMVAWLTLIIPGIVVLLTTPFFGPMPRAAAEGRAGVRT